MTAPDIINGSFELLGGFFILLSILRLYKDKKVRGVSVVHVAFFWAWGVWNVFYYPHLGQLASTIGAWIVLTANTVWTGMLIYYRLREKHAANKEIVTRMGNLFQ